MSSSVFLSNVDDYLAPSQACVNPLFSEKTNAAAAATDTTPETTTPSPAATVGAVVARRQRRRPRNINAIAAATTADNNDNDNNTEKETVKASLADCLACSGCVTTAETVLLEETHSLQLLRNRWAKRRNDDDNDDDDDDFDMDAAASAAAAAAAESSSMRATNPMEEEDQQHDQPMVATISPAAWADLFRHVSSSSGDSDDDNVTMTTNNNNNHADAHRQLQRQWVTLLAQTLGVGHVLDGNLALQWSLDAAAQEFCHAHQQQQQQSTSSSSSSVLASSCPAVVCLVEKSSHGAVPHLSTTPSPQGMAGIFWKQQQQQQQQQQHSRSNTSPPPFHVAIMPCHDKKLEASRSSLLMADPTSASASSSAEVDLVLTTQDCIKLVLERLHETNTKSNKNSDDDDDEASSVKILRRALQQAAPSKVIELEDTTSSTTPAKLNHHLSTEPTLWAPPLSQMIVQSDGKASANNGGDTGSTDATSTPFVYASGGYADYIFRVAARTLYGVKDLPSQLPWTPVATQGRRVSARVAAAARDYYQVALYAHSDGSYSCYNETPNSSSNSNNNNNNNNNNNTAAVPVLKFAIAYGMQTLQRVLTPYENKKGEEGSAAADDVPYHYVEAMACPSGCVNGGGQVRLAERERPTQTQERVKQTRAHMARPTKAAPLPVDSSRSPPLAFRAVAPLQLNQGAVKGVAVKDVQW